jgi:hypothetical protein
MTICRVRYFSFSLYFVFSLYERKNEIQSEYVDSPPWLCAVAMCFSPVVAR